MARLAILSLLVIAGYTHAFQRIVGGSPSSVETHPSIVQVAFFNRWTEVWSQSCGATIINNINVLSAAHCFHGPNYETSHRQIRAGATYRNTGGVVVYVQNEVNHPSFNPETLDNDITIVRLTSPLIFNAVIQPASIPPQGSVIVEGLPVVQAGWGLTATDGMASSVLLQTQVYVIRHELCRQLYQSLSSAITDNMICTGVLNVGGRGSCGLDAGGPVFYDSTIVGVISWAEGCGDRQYPSVSAAVSPHTSWIIRIAQSPSI